MVCSEDLKLNIIVRRDYLGVKSFTLAGQGIMEPEGEMED